MKVNKTYGKAKIYFKETEMKDWHEIKFKSNIFKKIRNFVIYLWNKIIGKNKYKVTFKLSDWNLMFGIWGRLIKWRKLLKKNYIDLNK